jgi:hypothetical protein
MEAEDSDKLERLPAEAASLRVLLLSWPLLILLPHCLLCCTADASMEAEDSDELQELEAEEEEEEEEAAAADRSAGQLGTRAEVYDEGAGSYEVGGKRVGVHGHKAAAAAGTASGNSMWLPHLVQRMQSGLHLNVYITQLCQTPTISATQHDGAQVLQECRSSHSCCLSYTCALQEYEERPTL